MYLDLPQKSLKINLGVHLSLSIQQLQNIPITGVFVYTVPEDTKDCNDNPNYDWDQVGQEEHSFQSSELSSRFGPGSSTLSSTASLVAHFPLLEGLWSLRIMDRVSA